MIGGVGLKGPNVTAALIRQRVTVAPRSTRTISSFRPQRLRVPGPRDQLNPMLSGSVPWRTGSVAASPSSMRFNSTVSNASPTTGTSPASTRNEFPDIDLSDPIADPSAIPERIGYLKELGLDYGIGPSSLMQFIIEHIHIWTGLPWWASIVGAGVLTRVAVLKFAVGASNTQAKLHNLKPVLSPLRQEQLEAARNGDRMLTAQKKAEIQQVNKDNGIQPWKSFLPMIQVPLGYGCFRVVRGMAALPVPGLANESVAWISDLTVADPFFLLPASSAVFLYFTFKKGGEGGSMEVMKTNPGKMMLFGLPAITFACTAFFPSALQLYFASTGLLGLGQAYLFHSKPFRDYMNLEMWKPKPKDGMDDTNSKGLRSFYKRIDEEKAKAAEEKAQASGFHQPEPRNGWVKRMLGGVQNYGRQVSDETLQKLREYQGQGQGEKKNADGSPAAPPRLSEAERSEAQDYEHRRRHEDDTLREKRNSAARREHQRKLQSALQAEKEKAKNSRQHQRQSKLRVRP